MRFITPVILLSIFGIGCQTHPVAPTAAQLREKLRTVTLMDGISQAEAQIIGDCYFSKNVGCGAFYGVHDGGDRWIADAAFGPVASPIKDFYIDKASGRVASPIGLSYENPLDIFP